MNLLSNFEYYKISSLFLVKWDDKVYKHTNELHQILKTGKHTRNIVWKEINFVHIIKHLVKVGYKINYIGWGLTIPDIVGDKKNEINENKYSIKNL